MAAGGFGTVVGATEVLAPGLLDKQLAVAGYPIQQTDEPKTEAAPDNLFDPSPGPWAVRGGWNGRKESLYMTLKLNPAARRAALGAAALAGLTAARSRRARR